MRRAGNRWTAAALWLGSLCVVPSIRADLQGDLTAILEQMPEGSEQVRAAWLYDTARATRDARLAYVIMETLTRRYDGPAAHDARLWKVRCLAAAGDTAAAHRELRAADLQGPEADYWRTLLTDDVADAVDAPATSATLPPWALMRAIAATGRTDRQQRAALELEGAARRWGLLGPWLWRLVRSEEPALLEAARAVLEAPQVSLPAAPERTRIVERLEALTGPLVPRAAPRLPTRPQGGDVYAVQVGVFTGPAEAQALARELATHGFEAHVAPVAGAEGETLHQVRLGHGLSLAAAESLGTALGQTLMLSHQIVRDDGAPAGPAVDNAGQP